MDIVERESENIIDKPELKKINKSIILDTLVLTDGNKKRAAEILGVSRQTIYRILNTG